jgi:polyhydroxyalkanoate synthesis regulator phasin
MQTNWDNMNAQENRLHVLKMVQEGKITAEEGVKLLERIENKGVIPSSSEQSSSEVNTSTPRWMKIIITDLNTNKEKINIRLPANVIDAGLKMGARFSPDLKGVDANSILQALQAGKTGKVIDICDDDACERIVINFEP